MKEENNVEIITELMDEVVYKLAKAMIKEGKTVDETLEQIEIVVEDILGQIEELA